jgi:hypothetical protein
MVFKSIVIHGPLLLLPGLLAYPPFRRPRSSPRISRDGPPGGLAGAWHGALLATAFGVGTQAAYGPPEGPAARR